ncbi:MAG: hypothetical protein ABR874_16840 [Candidatus Sulfotelmatobacter sp.]|jgi:hypothetical protein
MSALHSSTLDSTNRQPSNLTERLDKHLLAYVAAAGAAGVSVLAMTQPAESKVVYTPANRSIVEDSRLDLNNDGIPDYAFHGPFAFCGTCSYFDVIALKFNKLMSNAEPLAAGISVGPDDKFRAGRGEMLFGCTCSGHPYSGGPWNGIQNEYMGFEFNIKGAAHFGWARFSVSDKAGITLTGYAYETISLKPIVTGDTTGSDDEDSVDQPAPAAASQASGLGRLALGVAGLTAQRDAR